MKGVVFSEFIEMVEEEFSPEIADAIIEESDLASGGMYTAVGTYEHEEMLTLVVKLSEKTGIAVPDLVNAFGRYLFERFFTLYPTFFDSVDGAFSFLETIEDHVHSEVRKLYHDVELPTFETRRPDDKSLIMEYRSRRPFADLALGLLNGCAAHYGEDVDIEETELGDKPRTHVRFLLTKR